MAEGKSAGTGGGQLVCPECGKSFSRPAALGSHRRGAHGVAGSSRVTSRGRDSAGRRRRRAPKAETSSTPSTPTTRRASSHGLSATVRRTSGVRRRSASSDGRLDRNQLLKTLFPNGVPPREEVLSAVNSWLDEAERLAAQK
jgi:hypothetical protein